MRGLSQKSKFYVTALCTGKIEGLLIWKISIEGFFIDNAQMERNYISIFFNKAFGNPPKSQLYFSQDRIKKSSYF